ncbi:hypothetical protein BDV34DRAFT_149346 [Aspergillus parasiticus]|uniref:Uncharacterized protein n=1 Tax=Aspergillus parasiticus TaxID=5067 RepID=A0A5N6DB65_ASPPA|nr:hypothetical protein BDV34DRAFT_149346 [Aspergillus parasiticus]
MRLSSLILMGSSPAGKTLLGRFDRRTVRYGSIELLNTKSIKSIYFFFGEPTHQIDQLSPTGTRKSKDKTNMWRCGIRATLVYLRT